MALVARELLALQAPDAVLRADAAAERAARCRARRSWIAPACARNARRVAARGSLTLKCRLPSPTCPYATRRAVGHDREDRGRGLRQERGQRSDRHRHVVLDAGALGALRLRDRLAQLPQCRRAARAIPRARRRAPGRRPAPARAPPSSRPRSAASSRAVDELAKHVGVVRRAERVRHARDVPRGQLERDPRQVLEARDGVAGCGAQAREQLAPPLPGRAPRRKPSRRCAVRGNSLRLAAVITPSVPSAPMNRSRRS